MNQLEQIRGYLRNREITLCRIGRQPEWVALGLPFSPTLRYHQGRWKASHAHLQTLVNQAIGYSDENSFRRSTPKHGGKHRSDRQ